MLTVRRVELDNFMSHRRFVFDVPAMGRVAVTGPNGSGKSAIFEAVAWCLWGRTIRGTDPVPRQGECVVIVTTDAVTVTRRRRRGKKTRLQWCRDDEVVEPATATKGQPGLDAIVGDFEAWHRTSVLVPGEAARFTSATDAERKRFLESLLGLTRFDPALKRCRVDTKAAASRVTTTLTELATAEALFEAAARRLDDVLAGPHHSGGDDATTLDNLRRALRADVGELDTRIDASRHAATPLRDQAAMLRAVAVAAKDRAAKLEDVSECPTCGQGVDEELRVSFVNAAAAAIDQSVVAACTAGDARNKADTEVRRLVGTRRVLVERIEEARSAAQARRHHDAAMAERGRLADRAEDDRRGAAKRIAAAVVAWTRAVSELATARVVESVLGLRGVRARLGARALDALTSGAGVWLARLGLPGLGLSLVSSGDTIALDITGAGDGLGYRAASGGERRRIDVALTLALAELAAAGHDPGTMWLDEVLDSPLDADGRAAASRVLHDLAETRAVVVITQEAELADLIGGRHVAMDRADTVT